MAECAACRSVGPQLHPGKRSPYCPGRHALSGLPPAIRALDVLDAGRADPLHTAACSFITSCTPRSLGDWVQLSPGESCCVCCASWPAPGSWHSCWPCRWWCWEFILFFRTRSTTVTAPSPSCWAFFCCNRRSVKNSHRSEPFSQVWCWPCRCLPSRTRDWCSWVVSSRL